MPPNTPQTYNGVKVSITNVQQVTVSGTGAGAVNGPAVAFTFTMVNGSKNDLPLNVAVTANNLTADAYGSGGLSGTLVSGATQSGSYAAAIPTSDRGHIVVDFNYLPNVTVSFVVSAS